MRGDEMLSKLAPCQNCLKLLNYDGFDEEGRRERRMIANDFDIQNFSRIMNPFFVAFHSTIQTIFLKAITQRIGLVYLRTCA